MGVWVLRAFDPEDLLDLDPHLGILIEGEGSWLVAGRPHLRSRITAEATGFSRQTEEVAIHLPIAIQILIDDDSIGTRLQLEDNTLRQGIGRSSQHLDRLLEVVLRRVIYGDKEVAFLLLHTHDIERQSMGLSAECRDREEDCKEQRDISSVHRGCFKEKSALIKSK